MKKQRLGQFPNYKVQIPRSREFEFYMIQIKSQVVSDVRIPQMKSWSNLYEVLKITWTQFVITSLVIQSRACIYLNTMFRLQLLTIYPILKYP